MVAEGDWGPVLCLRGQYQGMVGYYDDDDDPGCAIVYFGVPYASQAHLIDRSWLEPTGTIPPILKRWVAENPVTAEEMGVVLTRTGT